MKRRGTVMDFSLLLYCLINFFQNIFAATTTSGITEIKSKAVFEKMLQSDRPALVLHYMNGCQHCPKKIKMFKEEIKQPANVDFYQIEHSQDYFTPKGAAFPLFYVKGKGPQVELSQGPNTTENNVQILEGPAAITTFMEERRVPALIVLRYLKGCPHCKEIIDFWDGLKIPKGYVLAKTTSAEALKNCGVPQRDIPGVPGVYAFYYQPNEEPHKRKYKQISIGSIEKEELEKRIEQIIS